MDDPQQPQQPPAEQDHPESIMYATCDPFPDGSAYVHIHIPAQTCQHNQPGACPACEVTVAAAAIRSFRKLFPPLDPRPH